MVFVPNFDGRARASGPHEKLATGVSKSPRGYPLTRGLFHGILFVYRAGCGDAVLYGHFHGNVPGFLQVMATCPSKGLWSHAPLRSGFPHYGRFYISLRMVENTAYAPQPTAWES